MDKGKVKLHIQLQEKRVAIDGESLEYWSSQIRYHQKCLENARERFRLISEELEHNRDVLKIWQSKLKELEIINDG